MKRVLVVANDRSFTRFVAESLLGRPLDGLVPRPDDPWEPARAHTGLEAELLLTRAGRRFDALIVDRELDDQSPIALLRRLRLHARTRTTPVFLVSERGRDPHNRREATEQLGIAGFLERPVTAQSLEAAMQLLGRRRRLLLVDPDPDVAQRYAAGFDRRGFDVITASSREGALKAKLSFDPDIVAIGVAVDGHGGLDVCSDLKRSSGSRSVPVALYGQLRSLPERDQCENALRADDYVQAPFDDAFLIERVIGLVGLGAPRSPEAGPPFDGPPSESRDMPTEPGVHLPPSPSVSVAPPPPLSASPSSTGPSSRKTRRVPCVTSLRIGEGEALHHARTLDISHGGLFFEIDPPLPVGTLVNLTFRLPKEDRDIEGVGRVAWVSPRGVGVKFNRIDKADLLTIVDYVNQVSRVLYSSN